MAKRVQLRRGTTAQINAFTGAVGEVSVDTDKDVLVVHDGVTEGGFPVAARANNDGTISLIKKDGTVSTTIPANGLLNNTLTSTATNQAATAAQAKVLKDLVDTKITASDTIANAGKLTTATGSAPSYSARAWVNFSAYGHEENIVIKGQGNVASVTDNGVGDYTINFTTAMSDENYAVALAYSSGVAVSVFYISTTDNGYLPKLKTASALRVRSIVGNGTTEIDVADASVVIYQ